MLFSNWFNKTLNDITALDINYNTNKKGSFVLYPEKSHDDFVASSGVEDGWDVVAIFKINDELCALLSLNNKELKVVSGKFLIEAPVPELEMSPPQRIRVMSTPYVWVLQITTKNNKDEFIVDNRGNSIWVKRSSIWIKRK